MALRTVLFRRPRCTIARVLSGRRFLLLLAVATFSVGGCQPAPSVSVRQLIAHEAMLDFTGLDAPGRFIDVKMLGTLPQGWDARPLEVTPLYTAREWRSPSRSTAVGVVYLHLPFPVSAKLLVWLARSRYAQERQHRGQSEARMIDQWTDPIGREWVEAENVKYHVRGYAITNGFDAWIVYSGYRLGMPMNLMEIGLAARSVDAMVPLPLEVEPRIQK